VAWEMGRWIMSNRSYSQVVLDATEEYIEHLKSLPTNQLPSPRDAASELMSRTVDEIELENSVKVRSQKFPVPRNLSLVQVAMLVPVYFKVVRISCAGESTDESRDLLGVYQTDEPNMGLYATDDATLRRTIRLFRFDITKRDFEEVQVHLRDLAPRMSRCVNPDYIPVNNGIFDYRSKQFHAFSPDVVLLSKCRINYNPNAWNVLIHNDTDGTDWDVVSWMNSLSDDPQVVLLLWQIVGAIIRPFVSWDKFILLYSESGSNGKGTLCELLRQLCGEGTYASIPLSDMGKDFMLEPLTHATAVIVDENDVGTYIDKAAILKAIVTHDVIQINRKYMNPIAYRFFGLVVQCINELPRIKDKSDSFYRRMLMVPMPKCFTGHERKYIKQEYLHRPDVLEYVLKLVLESNYDTFTVPKACLDLQAEYKEYNDPLRQFTAEILPLCRWHLLPFTFLYDLYKAWLRINQPSGAPVGRNTFIKELIKIACDNPEWICLDKSRKIPTQIKSHGIHLMPGPEPLIGEYNLTGWINGANQQALYCPKLNDGYRGLVRRSFVKYLT
jgi:putative DNA primase/helicase